MIAALDRLDIPVLDRAALGDLFGVRRRQAITLMHQFGGYQAGKTFLLNRVHLIQALREIYAHDDFGRERRRKQRFATALDELRRLQPATRVVIAPPPALVHESPSLPSGVDLRPGSLTIQFDGPEDLLTKLFSLAQTIAADFEAFRRTSSRD